MTEVMVSVESVKVPVIRDQWGPLTDLGESIRREGLGRAVTLWTDGTIISGLRRHRAHVLLGRKEIPAVFVHTIEDAAKRLHADLVDDHLARPMKLIEVCRLWSLMRRLEEPAAAARFQAHRQRGVELRRLTQEGKREPGRANGETRSDDYALSVLAESFDMSTTTAKRLWLIYSLTLTPNDKRADALRAFDDIDAGRSSIWANYQRLSTNRSAPVSTPRPATPPVSAPAATQVAAWNRSLPQLEGLIAGLAELGPPNDSLSWEQIQPAYVRLMAVRRDLEKMIKKMRESEKS